MKILFCTDGSNISYSALKNISNWIKKATIDIICVIDWSFLPNEINIEEINFATSCTNVADTILDYAEQLVKRAGFEVDKKIKHCGSAIESILDETENSQYDLILMGSNGKKGLQKWLGSVSQEIINHSNISDYISKSENNKEKILFTTDGSPCSSAIISKVLPKLNLENKQIYICIVTEDPKMLFLNSNIDQNWLTDIQKKQRLFAEQSIEEINSILQKYNINTAKSIILNGNPSQEIIQYSKENEIDLIVLGTKNKSRLDRFLTGSESIRILENTMSDVWLERCT